MTQAILYLVSAAAGLLCGWTSVVLFLHLCPISSSAHFWALFHREAALLISMPDDADFKTLLHRISALLQAWAAYMARVVGGLALSCLPIVLLLGLYHIPPFRHYLKQAMHIDLVFLFTLFLGSLVIFFFRHRKP